MFARKRLAALCRKQSILLCTLIVVGCGDDGGSVVADSGMDTIDGAIAADAMPRPDADPSLPVCNSTTFAGEGTALSPYQLCDGALLSLIATSDAFLGATYEMDRDISAPANFTAIGPQFLGTIEGNGHAIVDLGTSTAPQSQGLFIRVGSGGTVSDLRVEGVIDDVDAQGVGLLAGTNSGTLSNVAVSGSVVARDHSGLMVGINGGTISLCESSGTMTAGAHSGGVAGENTGLIEQCHSSASLSGGSSRQGGVVGTQQATGTLRMSVATGTVAGNGVETGCLVGSLFGGSIENCAGRCTLVSNGDIAGGLIGGGSNGDSSISKSYAWSVAVTGTRAGGLIGSTEGVSVTVVSSYFNSEVTAASAGGTGLTEAQLKMQASFVDWDFTTIWELPTDEAPALRWRTSLPTPGTL